MKKPLNVRPSTVEDNNTFKNTTESYRGIFQHCFTLRPQRTNPCREAVHECEKHKFKESANSEIIHFISTETLEIKNPFH